MLKGVHNLKVIHDKWTSSLRWVEGRYDGHQVPLELAGRTSCPCLSTVALCWCGPARFLCWKNIYMTTFWKPAAFPHCPLWPRPFLAFCCHTLDKISSPFEEWYGNKRSTSGSRSLFLESPVGLIPLNPDFYHGNITMPSVPRMFKPICFKTFCIAKSVVMQATATCKNQVQVCWVSQSAKL